MMEHSYRDYQQENGTIRAKCSCGGFDEVSKYRQELGYRFAEHKDATITACCETFKKAVSVGSDEFSAAIGTDELGIFTIGLMMDDGIKFCPWCGGTPKAEYEK